MEMIIYKNRVLLSLIWLITASCTNQENLTTRYGLDYSSNNTIWLTDKVKSSNGYSVMAINGHILFYAKTKNYVILMQNPDDIKFRNRYQFWIIDNRTENIMGPFNKKEYFEKRRLLKIPIEVKFNTSTLHNYSVGDKIKSQYENLDPSLLDIKNLKGNIPYK